MSEMDQSLPNWVVRDMSGSHPMATEETDIRRRSYAGRAALKAGVSPDSRNQMHLKVLVWHHRLFPGATGDRERHALAWSWATYTCHSLTSLILVPLKLNDRHARNATDRWCLQVWYRGQTVRTCAPLNAAYAIAPRRSS